MGQFRCLYVEESKWVLIYHPAKDSNPSGPKTSTLNVKADTINQIKEKMEYNAKGDNFLHRTPTVQTVRSTTIK